MSIAHRVSEYLTEQGVDFDLVGHPHSATSAESAHLAHVPGDRIAKSVVLGDERGYLMAVKGAPEAILQSSSHVLTTGSEKRDLNDKMREKLLQANEALADKGLRVLGVARKSTDAVQDNRV